MPAEETCAARTASRDIRLWRTFKANASLPPQFAATFSLILSSGQPRKFDINSGENTAFDRAIMYAPGAVSHFHSPDLTNEKGYRNQRDHWADFYKSTIVVPIRSMNPMKIGLKDCSHDMGFLSVDTLSTHRLNDKWHVELLAAFADQMYNFLSLTKGTYSLPDSAADSTPV